MQPSPASTFKRRLKSFLSPSTRKSSRSSLSPVNIMDKPTRRTLNTEEESVIGNTAQEDVVTSASSQHDVGGTSNDPASTLVAAQHPAPIYQRNNTMYRGISANLQGIDARGATLNDVGRDQIINITAYFDAEPLDKLRRAKSARWDYIKTDECLNGTRTTVLEGIQKWIIDNNPQRIYWLNGLAGTGKSTLAKSIAHFAEDNGLLGASFFCSREEETRSNVDLIFPTLAYQLSETVPGFGTALIEVIKKRRDIDHALSPDQLLKMIVEPLQVIGNPGRPLLMVIDALDECKEENASFTILMALSRCIDSIPFLKVFVTSRPSPATRNAFKIDLLKRQSNIFMLHLVDRELVNSDIRHFLTVRLKEMVKYRSHESFSTAWPEKELVERLVQKASGLFIFASTVCKFIASPGDLNGQLEQIAWLSTSDDEGRLGIDQLYQDVLDTAMANLSDKNQRHYHSILGTIILLQSPLSLPNLSQLLGLTTAHVAGLLTGLHSVLIIPSHDDKDGVVRTIHASFRDFLTNPKRCLSPRSLVRPSLQHRDISFRLFDGMMESLKRNICEIDLFVFNRDVEDLTDRTESFIGGSLAYSCRYWADHLVCASRDEVDIDQLVATVDTFVQTKLLYWIETISLLGCMEVTVSALQKVRDWYSEVSQPGSELGELLEDAYRTVLEFFDAIKASAAQVYLSALPLMPNSSVLGKSYRHELLNLIRVPFGIQNKWTPCLRTISGVGGAVFSPDDSCIASTSDIGAQMPQIWDARTGELRMVLEGDQVQHSVTFLPQGLICGSTNEAVKVWDLEIGVLKHTLKGRLMPVYPSGDQRVIVTTPTGIQLWDPMTGQYEMTFSRASSEVHTYHRRLNLGLWDGELRELPKSVADDVEISVSSSMSPDGTRIACGHQNNNVNIWDISTGKQINCYPPAVELFGGGWILSVAFSPSGSYVAGSANDICVWNAKTGKLQVSLRGHSAQIDSISFSSNDQQIVSSSKDGTIKIWAWKLGDDESVADGHRRWISSITFSEDGSLVASGSWNGSVAIWDASTGRIKTLQVHHDWAVMSVAFSPDGQLLASGGREGDVVLWDVTKQERKPSMDIGYNPGCNIMDHSSVTFSKDGRLIAFSLGNSMAIFDAESCKRVVGPLRDATKNPILSFAFSPSGSSLAVGCNNEIFIWSSHLDHDMTPYNCHNRRVRFSDGRIRLLSESGESRDLQWHTLADGRETLDKAADRRNGFYMHKGWIMDMDGKAHYWVPEVYRGRDLYASCGRKLALGGGRGQVMVLELLPEPPTGHM